MPKGVEVGDVLDVLTLELHCFVEDVVFEVCQAVMHSLVGKVTSNENKLVPVSELNIRGDYFFGEFGLITHIDFFIITRLFHFQKGDNFNKSGVLKPNFANQYRTNPK
jgi:hypothetical protein